ncbi:MAG TPA: hypothetical protein VGE01_11355, partial [Fimbriimonas sp.]
TMPQEKEGDFKQWVGVTDEQQAQWIVRAYLALAAMDLERAYLFWFNDENKASIHGSSGLTRNYQPKPSFHAVAHLQSVLGEYRFERAVAKDADHCLYEFSKPGSKIWVVWSPTGSGRTATVTLPKPTGSVVSAERMPLAAGAPTPVPVKILKGARLEVAVTESPLYIRFQP